MTASSRRRESVQAPCVAGFDYGTSHCSIGLWRDGAVQMVPLQGEQTLVESTLYAPMAAALDYESRLDCDQRVLVVDIGGGTTDCSFLKVGPQRARQKDRNRDILGHAGERLGGNDYGHAEAWIWR